MVVEKWMAGRELFRVERSGAMGGSSCALSKHHSVPKYVERANICMNTPTYLTEWNSFGGQRLLPLLSQIYY